MVIREDVSLFFALGHVPSSTCMLLPCSSLYYASLMGLEPLCFDSWAERTDTKYILENIHRIFYFDKRHLRLVNEPPPVTVRPPALPTAMPSACAVQPVPSALALHLQSSMMRWAALASNPNAALQRGLGQSTGVHCTVAANTLLAESSFLKKVHEPRRGNTYFIGSVIKVLHPAPTAVFYENH